MARRPPFAVARRPKVHWQVHRPRISRTGHKAPIEHTGPQARRPVYRQARRPRESRRGHTYKARRPLAGRHAGPASRAQAPSIQTRHAVPPDISKVHRP